MLSLATFGAGFLMRPLGAIVLGAYIDHRGRRDGLLLTLGLMAIGTVSIACTPSYASIGLVCAAGGCRRADGGGTFGRSRGGWRAVYLYKVAPAGYEGFYMSWQAASQQDAVMFAAVLALG
jgi:hypothetical protein